MVRARWAFVLLIALSATAAGAAEVIYPPASRIGIIPPPGMQLSARYWGFEDREKGAVLLLSGLPARAFAEFERSDGAEVLKQQGATLERRETLTLAVGTALLVEGLYHEAAKEGAPPSKGRAWMLVASTPDLTVLAAARVPEAAQEAYPEATIRAAFASLKVRPQVPVEEQLGLLPFKVSELAGFKIGGILLGRAVTLTDVAGAAADKAIAPRLTVTLLPSVSVDTTDRNELARTILGTVTGIKEVHVSESQMLRLGGQQTHELMATAKEAESGADIGLVQWLRFGGSASLHLFGIAPATAWTQAYARFRSVRDGIEPR
jgi:hypothetical protein